MTKHEMLTTIPAMNSNVLRVSPERCVLVRHRKALCLRCANVCTTSAISLTEEGISVNPELCIGCGTCASACPSACLEALNPSDESLSKTLQHLATSEKRVAIACEKALDLARAHAGAATNYQAEGYPLVEVVCLGRLEESILIEGVARGIESIRLISESCADCEHKLGGAHCDDVCASANRLLTSMGHEAAIARVRAEDLAFSADNTASEASQLIAPKQTKPTAHKVDKGDTLQYFHVQKDGTLSHYIPQRRMRLYNSLKQLGTIAQDKVETSIWGQVHINTELCRSCRMCTVFCPTGSLARFNTKSGGFGVSQRSTLCTQCRLCETICPEQALSVTNQVSLRAFLDGEKASFEMLPLEWKPSSETAIATRVSRFIKTDAFQDPQGTITRRSLIEGREYAKSRARRREEIRAEEG